MVLLLISGLIDGRAASAAIAKRVLLLNHSRLRSGLALEFRKTTHLKDYFVRRSDFGLVDLSQLRNVPKDDPGVDIVPLVEWKHNAALVLGNSFCSMRLLRQGSDLVLNVYVEAPEFVMQQFVLALGLLLHVGVLQADRELLEIVKVLPLKSDVLFFELLVQIFVHLSLYRVCGLELLWRRLVHERLLKQVVEIAGRMHINTRLRVVLGPRLE